MWRSWYGLAAILVFAFRSVFGLKGLSRAPSHRCFELRHLVQNNILYNISYQWHPPCSPSQQLEIGDAERSLVGDLDYNARGTTKRPGGQSFDIQCYGLDEVIFHRNFVDTSLQCTKHTDEGELCCKKTVFSKPRSTLVGRRTRGQAHSQSDTNSAKYSNIRPKPTWHTHGGHSCMTDPCHITIFMSSGYNPVCRRHHPPSTPCPTP